MFRSVKETFRGEGEEPPDYTFWTYLIVPEPAAGRKERYHLFRVDCCVDKMERLGHELTLGHCRKIIKQHEPTYPKGRVLHRIH